MSENAGHNCVARRRHVLDKLIFNALRPALRLQLRLPDGGPDNNNNPVEIYSPKQEMLRAWLLVLVLAGAAARLEVRQLDGGALLGEASDTECGNGLLENGEVCDDGNRLPNDGCSSDCKLEAGWECTGGSGISQDHCSLKCGDSRRFKGSQFPSGGEECDDGNKVDGDGCSSSCEVEAGYGCYGGTTTRRDACRTIRCGDGKRAKAGEDGVRDDEPDTEACDDGNQSNGDGCSSSCTVEAGYECTGGSARSKDTCTILCGDGKRMGAEECDDGNTINNDGCSSECEIETGWNCTGGSVNATDVCNPNCGDSLRFKGSQFPSGGEECDDGNKVDGDGCSSSCQVEAGYGCYDGTTTSADTCVAISCGDGKRAKAGEDGVRDDEPDTEACDDGNTINGDGCSSSCTVETGYECTGGSLKAADTCTIICGDGKRVDPEGCDDGNTVDNDGCSSTCVVEAGWTCAGGDVDNEDSCEPVCGDGKRIEPEGCDDGNTVDDDGCSSGCVVEDEGFFCTGGTSLSEDTCAEHECGDGRRTGEEECDDDNTDDADGCNSSCTVESGYTCAGGDKENKDACEAPTPAPAL